MRPSSETYLKKMFNGDRRALAKLITLIDNHDPDTLEIMSRIYHHKSGSTKIGITGPPGSGKSTLVDKFITHYRQQGKTVGVVAIDPSSPFSGGAVLGDRIRMQEHSSDKNVFIRSLGSRGAHGGLSRATRDIVALLDAFGLDVILIETVGVGQTELDIMSVAHTTLVVLVPESGDTIQTMKAGLMEIADVFIVNKADRDGADQIAAELVSLSEMYSSEGEVPVIKTTAIKNEGIDKVITAIKTHTIQKTKLTDSSLLDETIEIFTLELSETLLNHFQNKKEYKDIAKKLKSQKLNPYSAVLELKKMMKTIFNIQ